MSYDFREMTRQTGISARQLYTWTERGYLELAEYDAKEWAHQGYARNWSQWAFHKATIMGRLAVAGIQPATASALLEQSEVKEDIQDNRKWVTATLVPGITINIRLREDWQ